MPRENPATLPEADRNDRYGVIVTDSGETYLYDREQPDAWIQSDHVVEVRATA